MRWICLLLLLVASAVRSQPVFRSVESLMEYAKEKSLALQSGDIRLSQAKQSRLAAILSIPDVTGGASLTYTNNTRLPVNLFPAEVFGGQPGTFKEVQTGIQYVTNFNQNIDIKLVNPKGWENLKLAKLNIQAAGSDKQLTLKSLLEDIAATYFNIVTLQEQLRSARQNLAAADTLLRIAMNKQQQGIAKKQDVNDAQANYFSASETITQIQFSIDQQYLALKLLCDIPAEENIQIIEEMPAHPDLSRPEFHPAYIRVSNSILKEKIALANYRQTRHSLYPTLSFFQSYTTQQFNERGKLFDRSVNWIPSSFIGLRLSFTIPNANTITQLSQARYDHLLAKKNTEQQKIRAEIELRQLSVDFDKALSQAATNKHIYELRKDTYSRNLNIYNEGIIGLDQALASFNNMVSAQYNFIAAQVSVLLAKSKAGINNTIK
jgi:outer membrane protein TolC